MKAKALFVFPISKQSCPYGGPTGSQAELLNPLQHHGDTLSNSNTHAAKRISSGGALQLKRRRGYQARATGSQRMADRDRATAGVHVGGVVRNIQIAKHGERLRRESFSNTWLCGAA